RSEVRAAGGTVVATGGCFDLMHAGHARSLAGARKLGDCLIVCVNSDDSVRRLKGADRPIMTQADRAELLLSLECVDAVVVFEEDTPEEVRRQLQPDAWVKGGDHNADTLPAASALAACGGGVGARPARGPPPRRGSAPCGPTCGSRAGITTPTPSPRRPRSPNGVGAWCRCRPTPAAPPPASPVQSNA